MTTRLRILLACLPVLCVGIASATPAHAAAGARFGIKDDAWLVYGPGTLNSRLNKLEDLGVDIVRFTVRWDDVARRAPNNPQNPRDPAYRWGANDRVLKGLHAHGIAPLVTLVGTPGWANGGKSAAWAPLEGAWFGDFAYAVARRYPFVHFWTIWNEPNHASSLQPTTAAVYVNKLLNPAYAQIKRAIPTALVAGGVTAPRGNAGGVSPLVWIAGMGRAGAKLDAYAHHPYPLVPKVETPMSGGCEHCQSVTMATLGKLVKTVHKYLGPKRIWLTEYGYQTSPPDPWLGVSWALQALYVSEASLRAWMEPSVDMLINFMFKDDVKDWQSGFYSASGVAKPSLRAFTMPFAEVRRSGSRTTVWGQIRPRSGSQPYRLQVKRNGKWAWDGRLTGTRANGSFTRVVTASPGTLVRVWSPLDGAYSLELKIR